MKYLTPLIIAVLFAAWPVRAAEEHKHETGESHEHEQVDEAVTVKGEVLDMACYLSHGVSGDKHAECAAECIKSGLPVGLKGENGKTYLVIGEHKPINDKLVQYAGKTIKLRGKVTEKDGIHLLSNAEVVK